MALPTAVQNSLEKLRQGPVEVVFDPDGDAVSLFARGGVDVAFLRGREEAELDLIGVYDLYTTGDGAEFELSLPERSLDVLGCLFPDGVSGTAGGATYRGFGSTAGQSARGDALAVRMRPWTTRDSSTDQVVLWAVVPQGEARLRQGSAAPHTWVARFRALPDATKSDGELVGRIYAAARS